MSAGFIKAGLKLYDENKDDPDVTQQIIDYAAEKYPKLSTRSSALSKLKGSIIDTYYNEAAIPTHVQAMQLTREQYDEINTAASAKLRVRGQNCLTIPKGFIERILKGLYSDDFGQLFTALALATGRRSTELIKTAVFHPMPGKPNTALFLGRSKLRRGDADVGYHIPLLAPTTVVNQAMDKMRALLRDQPGLEYSSVLGRVVKSVTGDETFHPHTLRSIYAAAAYARYGSRHENQSSFTSRVLGHTTEGSSPNYMCIKIGDDPKKAYSITPFNTQGNAEVKAVERLLEFYEQNNKVPSLNQLRKLGTSYQVAKRVMDANVEMLNAMKI